MHARASRRILLHPRALGLRRYALRRLRPRSAHSSALHARICSHARCHVTGCEVAVGQRTALCAQKVALFTWHGATVELEGAPDISCVTPAALQP
jgi:hypothetical protein